MLPLLACLATIGFDEPPAAQREFRGAWVATVDNIDWPSTRTLATEQQQDELVAMLDLAKKLNLNALLFQVRPSADALYSSPHEPWSEFLTGAQGKAPKPKWDPLEFAIHEAHLRGIELHAWINPYRAWHSAHKGEPASTHVRNALKGAVVPYGNQYWLDPGNPAAVEHSLKVSLDIVRRYNVDGLHMDDYFYPYPVRSGGKLIPFPDDGSYSLYRQAGGKLAKLDWRRHNTNEFVRRLNHGIKAAKPWVKFGISPFGIYRPGVPKGIEAGIDQYNDLAADPVKWLREGWIDYLTPQLYWPISQKPQAYEVLMDWWAEQNPKGRHISIGNFASRLGVGTKWPLKELLDQIELTRKRKNIHGNVHFSFQTFSKNFAGVNNALTTGPYATRALPPASPWIDVKPPSAPSVRFRGPRVEALPGADPGHFFAIYRKIGGKWTLADVRPAVRFETLMDGAEAMAVSAIDRAGNESARSQPRSISP